jgi:hypothetical protein
VTSGDINVDLGIERRARKKSLICRHLEQALVRTRTGDPFLTMAGLRGSPHRPTPPTRAENAGITDQRRYARFGGFRRRRVPTEYPRVEQADAYVHRHSCDTEEPACVSRAFRELSSGKRDQTRDLRRDRPSQRSLACLNVPQTHVLRRHEEHRQARCGTRWCSARVPRGLPAI